MHHAGCDAGQAAQAGGYVQVAQQRGDAVAAQRRCTLGRRGQRQQARAWAYAAAQRLHDPQADIAAAHDQHAFTAKACGQRAKGVLV